MFSKKLHDYIITTQIKDVMHLFYILFKKEVKSQPKILGIKSSSQECQDEKDVKSNWSAKNLLLLMKLNILIMMTRPQNV